MTREIDPRSIADKAPRPERHVAVVVVGAGAAGVAAAIAAARSGAEVLLVDENPIDNDMMAMDVPLYFGQRMQPSVRNRALMLARVVDANPELARAHEAGVDVALGTYVWGAFVNGRAVRELPGPMLGLADDRRSWLLSSDGRWQRTERIMGVPGTIDAQQLLKARAAERSQAAAAPHRAHAGLGSLEPWA